MLEKRSHECRVSLKPSAREDVPAERTWLEKRTLLGRREAVELRVGALQGRRDSFPVFLFYLGLCATACGRRLWGLMYNCVSVAVCRVGRSYFFCIVFVCL